MGSKGVEQTAGTRSDKSYHIGENTGRGAAASGFHTHQVVRASRQRQGGTVGIVHVEGRPRRGFHGLVFHHKVGLGGIGGSPMNHSTVAGNIADRNIRGSVTIIQTTVEFYTISIIVGISGESSHIRRVIICTGIVIQRF